MPLLPVSCIHHLSLNMYLDCKLVRVVQCLAQWAPNPDEACRCYWDIYSSSVMVYALYIFQSDNGLELTVDVIMELEITLKYV